MNFVTAQTDEAEEAVNGDGLDLDALNAAQEEGKTRGLLCAESATEICITSAFCEFMKWWNHLQIQLERMV